mmetsp:Transcript_20875/g.64921  ORF Transcript_20875/g.64921 Transcript_20875/m.64921 type:complete len:207 (-) Transcript_20875:124-744(-)
MLARLREQLAQQNDTREQQQPADGAAKPDGREEGGSVSKEAFSPTTSQHTLLPSPCTNDDSKTSAATHVIDCGPAGATGTAAVRVPQSPEIESAPSEPSDVSAAMLDATSHTIELAGQGERSSAASRAAVDNAEAWIVAALTAAGIADNIALCDTAYQRALSRLQAARSATVATAGAAAPPAATASSARLLHPYEDLELEPMDWIE